MAIKIGNDGAIYNNDQAVESHSGTVIRDDGTIEMDNLPAGAEPFIPSLPVTRAAPVSPLERANANLGATGIVEPGPASPARSNIAFTERIAALEYDIRIAEGKKKGYSPTKYYIITGICLILTIITRLNLIFLIGTIVAGVFAVKKGSQAAAAERERQQLQQELDSLR